MPDHEYTWHEEFNGVTTYRIHHSGRVVAYGPERDGPQSGLWIASEWSAHPLIHDDAVHLRHLCADATRAELQQALREWESEMEDDSHV